MFCVNETVMYGNSGVCTIVDIRPEKFGAEEVLYYILKPVYHERSTIYCPVDNEKIKIRKLLSKQEVYDLIQLMPDAETQWIDNEQQRKLQFNNLLKSGSHEDLVRLIKTIYLNRDEKAKTGKKFHAADERVMKEAESLLYEELAHVLHIEPDDVVAFIAGQLEPDDEAKNA